MSSLVLYVLKKKLSFLTERTLREIEKEAAAIVDLDTDLAVQEVLLRKGFNAELAETVAKAIVWEEVEREIALDEAEQRLEPGDLPA